MQLKGPLKLNSHELYAAKDAPVEALWADEREKSGRLLEALNGTKTYVGPPRFRGRIRIGFDGLTEDEALRVLFELRTGRLTLTPRKNIGGGGAIDLDGDGIPDLILQEVELPVRVVSGIPSTSPLYRTSGGEIVHRIDEIEVETMQVYESIPGLTDPPVITYKAYAEYPDSVTLDANDAWTVSLNLTPKTKAFVDWDDGTTETTTNLTHEYPPDGGPYDITAVLFSGSLDNMRWRGDVISRPDDAQYVRVDLSPTDFGGLFVDTMSFSGDQNLLTLGTLSNTPDTRRWAHTGSSNLSYDASLIDRENEEIEISGVSPGPTGDVNDMPPDQSKFTVRAESYTTSVIQAGGPIGGSTTLINLAGSSVTLGSDFQASSVDNDGPAANVESLRTSYAQTGTEIAAIMRTMRKLLTFSGNNGFADLRDNAIPPSLTQYVYQRAGLEYAGSQYPWMSNVDFFFINPRDATQANSITNGTPQFPVLWRAFYNNRSDIPSRIEIDQSFSTGGGTPTAGIYCEATDPNDLWKMVGLHGFHPNNASAPASVFDAITRLRLGNLLSFAATSHTSSSITFSWTLPSLSSVTDSNGNLTAGAIYAYDDTAGDELIARVEKNGTRQWLPIFQSGEQMRYEESTGSKLFEIAGHSYDPSTDKATIDINTTSTQPGTDSNPTEDADLIYAFYFQSQP